MITFFGLAGRTAGLIRGKQISSRIENAEYITCEKPRVPNNAISILTRNHFSNITNFVKSCGNNVALGYDICDIAVGDVIHKKIDANLKNHCHDIYDFFIVNNDICAEEAEKYTKKPIYVIPHHTTNFDQKKINVNDEVKRIGYVGLPEQLDRSDDIKAFCESRNVQFISVHPDSQEECDRTFMSLDVGIIFLDAKSRPEQLLSAIKRYKPNVKVSNLQSYGIPTIGINYDSYNQFCGNSFMKIETFDELLQNIDLLIANKTVRTFLSDSSYEIAKRFHIDSIIPLYEKTVNDVLSKYGRKNTVGVS